MEDRPFAVIARASLCGDADLADGFDHHVTVPSGEGRAGRHVGLAPAHQGRALWPAGVRLVGDVPPDRDGALPAGLGDGLPDRGGAASRIEYPADRRLQPGARVRDHQFHPVRSAAPQAARGKPVQNVSASAGPIRAMAQRGPAAGVVFADCRLLQQVTASGGFPPSVRPATDGQWTRRFRIVNVAVANSNKIGILRECRQCEEAALVPVDLGGRT